MLTHELTEARISQYNLDTTKPGVVERFRQIRDRLLYEGLLGRFEFSHRHGSKFTMESKFTVGGVDRLVMIKFANDKIEAEYGSGDYEVLSYCDTPDIETAVFFVKRMLGTTDLY